MGREVIDAANRRSNVFFNLIYTDSFTDGQLEDCLKQYTANRLCFGTPTPFRYIEPQYVKLFCTEAVDDEQREDILYRNLAQRIKGC